MRSTSALDLHFTQSREKEGRRVMIPGVRMGAWKRRTPVLFAAAGALFVMSASCTTGGGPLALDTGLEINVLKWPTQPVAREGERDTAPVSGAVVLVESLAGGSTRRATTDSAGIARVQAAPGTHRVSV